MALRQKTVAPFSEHKEGVGSFFKDPRSNSVSMYVCTYVWSPFVVAIVTSFIIKL